MKTNNVKINKYRGVTLLETLIYIGLFGVVFITLIQFMISIGDNNQDVAERTDAARYKLFLYEHIEESIDWTVSINEVNSIFDVPNGILYLDNGADYIEYELSNGQLIVERSGGIPIAITPANISVTSFTIDELYGIDSQLIGVEVEVVYTIKNSRLEGSLNHLYRLY